MKYAEYIGWVGTIAILVAYGLLAFGAIGDGAFYHSMMLFGSAFVAVICYQKQTWQPFVINISFTLFAIIGLINHLP